MDNCILIQEQKVAWNKYKASKQKHEKLWDVLRNTRWKDCKYSKWRTQFKLVEAPTTYPTTYLSFGN